MKIKISSWNKCSLSFFSQDRMWDLLLFLNRVYPNSPVRHLNLHVFFKTRRRYHLTEGSSLTFLSFPEAMDQQQAHWSPFVYNHFFNLTNGLKNTWNSLMRQSGGQDRTKLSYYTDLWNGQVLRSMVEKKVCVLYRKLTVHILTWDPPDVTNPFVYKISYLVQLQECINVTFDLLLFFNGFWQA